MSQEYCVDDAKATIRTVSELLALKYKPDEAASDRAFADGVIRVTPTLTISEGPSASARKAMPMSYLFHPAVSCEKQGQGNQSAILKLTYMPRDAAVGNDAAKSDADEQRIKRALESL